jgi:hypothetical protein
VETSPGRGAAGITAYANAPSTPASHASSNTSVPSSKTVKDSSPNFQTLPSIAWAYHSTDDSVDAPAT